MSAPDQTPATDAPVPRWRTGVRGLVDRDAQERPPRPNPGPETRPARMPSGFTETVAISPAAPRVTGKHGQIERVDGFPRGQQATWDGPRRMTFRLEPGPWDESFVQGVPQGGGDRG